MKKKLPNPEECQRLCQETKKCEMFVYTTKEFDSKRKNYCYLINHISGKMNYKGNNRKKIVLGPKFCPLYEGMQSVKKLEEVTLRYERINATI